MTSIKYQKIDNYFYMYLLLITFSSITSQYIFKKAYAYKNANANTNANANANTNVNVNLLVILGLIAYTFTGYCIYKVLDYGNLVVLNIIWHLVYFTILFIIGFLIFS
jgi:hypothetical protein